VLIFYDRLAYQSLLDAMRTFDQTDDDELKSQEAQQLSLRAIRMALLSPKRFDFNDLRRLPSVQALAAA
jgi:translation initiation factor 3 subunit M